MFEISQESVSCEVFLYIREETLGTLLFGWSKINVQELIKLKRSHFSVILPLYINNSEVKYPTFRIMYLYNDDSVEWNV